MIDNADASMGGWRMQTVLNQKPSCQLSGSLAFLFGRKEGYEKIYNHSVSTLWDNYGCKFGGELSLCLREW